MSTLDELFAEETRALLGHADLFFLKEVEASLVLGVEFGRPVARWQRRQSLSQHSVRRDV